MFIHNLKYSLKTLFKNKSLIFWTFAFPIILGTFFNMAFSNIENSEKLDIIDIAIVETEEFKNNEIWKNAFETLSDEKNSDRLFSTQYVTEEKAKELLENKEISGYLLLTDTPKIIVKQSGINETILKFVAEEISENSKIIKNLSEKEIKEQMIAGNFNINYETIYEKVANIMENTKSNIENVSSSNLSYTMIEFYTLIAMTCLYGGSIGIVAINQSLANMSSKGKRVSVSPTKKGSLILSSVIAAYIIQIIGVALLFAYTIFALKVDYGNNFPLILLLALVGSFAGLSMGIAISSLIKANENTKTGILISVTMLGSFLSGMMGITMKYIIDKNMPIVNMLNPANMITDGFYALYYYDTLNRYWFNITSLLILSIIMIVISMSSLRRQKYDSI